MPDLQTELFKKVLPQMTSLKKDQTQSLDNLRFDDDPLEVPTDNGPNLSKQMWEYIRDNPGSTGSDIKAALNLPSAAVSTRLTQMFGRKWLTRKQNSVGVFTYYTVGTNYPAKDMPPTLKAALSKAQEVHRQKVATGTLHRKKVAEKKPKSSAPRKQTPHTNVTTSSKINVHQLPLGEARALYDELRKIFGA